MTTNSVEQTAQVNSLHHHSFPYEIDNSFIETVLAKTVTERKYYAIRSAQRIAPQNTYFAGIEAQVNIPDLQIFKQDKPAHVHEQYVAFVQTLSTLLFHIEEGKELTLPAPIISGYTLLIDEWKFRKIIEQRDACVRVQITEPKYFVEDSFLLKSHVDFLSTDRQTSHSSATLNLALMLNKAVKL